jgi:hypothetical protein
MPLPSPRKNQKKENFINSCMGSSTMNQEYKDPKQRLAVCHSQYKRSEAAQLAAQTAGIGSNKAVDRGYALDYDLFTMEQPPETATWDEIEFDNFLLLK